MVRHILGLSGKDSLTAALLIKARKPELWDRLEVFSTLTGADYPETIEWLQRLSGLLGKEISFIDGNLESSLVRRISNERAFLPSPMARYCTKEAKLQPFERWLGKGQAILYTGIRADEQRVGYKSSNQIESRFPLVDFNFNLGTVWAFILGLPEQFRPPTFYWEELHQLSREAWTVQAPLVGGDLDNHLSYAQKVVLMAGRSRPNCYFCFNQRRYEVVWLYEKHPDLFEKMMAWEKPEYSWIKGFPLAELNEKKRNDVKWNRACDIAKQVATQSFLSQSDGFETMASCGLFCGK